MNDVRMIHSAQLRHITPTAIRPLAQEAARRTIAAHEALPPEEKAELSQTTQALESRWSGMSLAPAQLRAAYLVAGSMVAGPAGLSLAGIDLDNLAKTAAEEAQKPDYQHLGILGMGFEKALAQQHQPVESLASALMLVGASPGPGPEDEALLNNLVQANPQAGIRCGSKVHQDHLYDNPVQTVVYAGHHDGNPNGVSEYSVRGKQMIKMDHLFSGDNEVVIGFGKPNVFTVVPNGEGGYEKLDAFMYYRKQAQIAGADQVQSGIFIRPRNLPPEALEDLKEAIAATVGELNISCARANARMLDKAGFTSGGRRFQRRFGPYHLFKQLAVEGLEYQGKKVEFDIINTTGGTLEEHFDGVIEKVISSPKRAIQKMMGSDKKPLSKEDISNMRRVLKTETQGARQLNEGDLVTARYRSSRPSSLGAAVRKWTNAPHTLHEILPDNQELDINEYLAESLTDKYHRDEKVQGFFNKAKSVGFSKPMVGFLRSHMAREFDQEQDFTTGQLLAMLPSKPEGEEPVLQTLVICGPESRNGNRVVITPVDNGNKAADWVLTKHLMASGYDNDVRFAGEAWSETYQDDTGQDRTRIHINGNSGTYTPDDHQTLMAGEYLQQLVGDAAEVVVHFRREQKPKMTQDVEKRYAPETVVAPELDGQVYQVADQDGKTSKVRLRHFKTIDQVTEYFDTPDRQIRAQGGMLRARTQLEEDGSVKEIEVESKMPVGDQGERGRVKGSEFESSQSFEAAKAQLLSPETNDPAVYFARRNLTENATLEPAFIKHTNRQLFLAGPAVPLVGWLMPQFIISVDNVSTTEPGDTQEKAHYQVIEPQIFTKLPWLKKISESRRAQFEDLARQIAERNRLTEVTQTAYEEASVKHQASS